MTMEVKAPGEYSKSGKTVFLAGSIEMGVAEEWQETVTSLITEKGKDDWTILNPRRDDWDSSWVQDTLNTNFNEQVSWELNGLENSNLVVVYFDPETKSPITLMELGLISMMNCFVIVCCPDGFWRKGNVQILCDKYSMELTDTKEEFFDMIERVVSNEFVEYSE